MSNPLWFKDAVIYQVHIKSFYDSTGDGIGDFRGLLEKIDYFQELGVTAVWLLPFYPSPLRDDGYDIADYRAVHPSYGTLEDFQTFLAEAHRRGLRVITELVLNHTSDQNPWFQRARRAPAGSVERDFYVWSDNPNKYRDARIIFKDFEASNWTWDPLAKAYYWHRFYSHQPDLNFDNPAVQEALFEVIDYWLGMGVDGLRLDAVPYLYEREGTNCENLPETHAFLKKLRKHIDEKFEDRMLLAEANQWPDDSAAYFGDGDECHMNFHFPLMPRLFMSLQMEDRFPIIDILDQTPAIPATCQWATFLRNHDELTLEMVTDEERDYMYRVYAHDPRARINLGIRRRLAPLLGNNRRRIELINALLFSLPGTPIVYYGDELGMGDNIYLGDRNGVRTPMQWAPDRNGGFSKANPQQLYLPAVIDPEYHYEAVNVETQQRNLSSLFWWMRRLITERKRWKALGSGTIEFLHPENAKVLAFVRKHEDETFLVLANLARFVQFVELDLSAYAGMVPMEVFSRAKFPEIRSGTTAFTLGPHDFFWVSLRRSSASAADPNAIPVLDQHFPWGGPLSADAREILEKELLPAYFGKARWFPGNARQLRDLKISEDFALRSEPGSARVLLVHASFGEGLPEVYVIPVQLSTGESGAQLLAGAAHGVLGRFRQGNEEAVLHEAIYDPAFRANLFDIVVGNANALNIRGRRGKGMQAEPFTEMLSSQVLSAEHANSTINYGSQYVLKLYRRLEWGKQPEEESLRFLGESRDFPNVPSYAGSIQYTSKDGATAVLGLLTGFVQNQGDAWAYTVDAVGRYLERVLVGKPELGNEEALLEAIGGVFPGRARQLAQRAAEMHLALTSDVESSPNSREEFSTLYQRSLYQSARGSLRRLGPLLSRVRPTLSPADQEAVDYLVRNEGHLLDGFNFLLHEKIAASKTIIHGSFHLGQVLNTGKDFVIIDLEGDPAKALSERSLKRSPLRDVASMLRSFDYAANSALTRQQPDDVETLRPWVQAWTKHVSEQFVEAYLEAVAGTNLVPTDRSVVNVLLDFYLVDKAIFEINNELTYRPSMVGVPLRALRELAEKRTTANA